MPEKTTSSQTSKPFAEVVKSSLHGFVAQSWQWDQFPSFGSLVVVESDQRTTFAIVHQIETGSMDPTRYPFAYKKTEAELLAEQPQIFEFLKTTFSCLTLGYAEGKLVTYQLAPEPTKIHAFVAPASEAQHQQFFSDNGYLHLLFGLSDQVFNLEELLLALLKQLSDRQLLAPAQMHTFIDAYSLLTGNDYRRLKLFLQRVERLTDSTPSRA